MLLFPLLLDSDTLIDGGSFNPIRLAFREDECELGVLPFEPISLKTGNMSPSPGIAEMVDRRKFRADVISPGGNCLNNGEVNSRLSSVIRSVPLPEKTGACSSYSDIGNV